MQLVKVIKEYLIFQKYVYICLLTCKKFKFPYSVFNMVTVSFSFCLSSFYGSFTIDLLICTNELIKGGNIVTILEEHFFL